MLRGAYDEAMEQINAQLPDLRNLATRVLSWITCARRPLTVLELQHALAVEFDSDSDDDSSSNDGSCDNELDAENLLEPEVMVSVCAGLVTVNSDDSKTGKTGIIRLVHYTTQEYFDQTQARWFPGAQLDIARTCARHLSYKTFAGGRCHSLDDYVKRGAENPLYYYAAEYWGHHTRNADTACRDVMAFLQLSGHVDAAAQPLSNLNFKPSPRRMRGLHLAAHFGLQRALQQLLLVAPPGAAAGGDPEPAVVPVDPDVRGWQDCTPLICAAKSGHESSVRLLLATGRVNVNAVDEAGGTSLLYAARNGHESVVRAILDRVDVNVETRDHFSRTPLFKACGQGHEGVVRMLLATGRVNINVTDSAEWTPLMVAAFWGRDGIVRMLLATEQIDINARNNKGRTALTHASVDGNEDVVRMVLATEQVDINARDNKGNTALSHASMDGHEDVVRMLLATEQIDINARDNEGNTALSHAAMDGHEGVVRMLLAADGIDVNPEGGFPEYGLKACWTPLGLALNRGHTAVAQLLRASGGREEPITFRLAETAEKVTSTVVASECSPESPITE